MSCFVEGRDEVVAAAAAADDICGVFEDVEGVAVVVGGRGVQAGEGPYAGLGGRDACRGEAKGALSGERRNVVRVSGVNVRC